MSATRPVSQSPTFPALDSPILPLEQRLKNTRADEPEAASDDDDRPVTEQDGREGAATMVPPPATPTLMPLRRAEDGMQTAAVLPPLSEELQHRQGEPDADVGIASSSGAARRSSHPSAQLLHGQAARLPRLQARTDGASSAADTPLPDTMPSAAMKAAGPMPAGVERHSSAALPAPDGLVSPGQASTNEAQPTLQTLLPGTPSTALSDPINQRRDAADMVHPDGRDGAAGGTGDTAQPAGIGGVIQRPVAAFQGRSHGTGGQQYSHGSAAPASAAMDRMRHAASRSVTASASVTVPFQSWGESHGVTGTWQAESLLTGGHPSITLRASSIEVRDALQAALDSDADPPAGMLRVEPTRDARDAPHRRSSTPFPAEEEA